MTAKIIGLIVVIILLICTACVLLWEIVKGARW